MDMHSTVCEVFRQEVFPVHTVVTGQITVIPAENVVLSIYGQNAFKRKIGLSTLPKLSRSVAPAFKPFNINIFNSTQYFDKIRRSWTSGCRRPLIRFDSKGMNRRSNLWKFVVIEQFRAMSVNESAECETILETEHRTQHTRHGTSLRHCNNWMRTHKHGIQRRITTGRRADVL